MLIAATALAVLVTMALALARALWGPTVYDRILAMNMFGTKTVLFIVILAFLMEETDVLDVALAYALINFIAVLAALKLVEYHDMGAVQESDVEVHDDTA